jgi:plastocyanin
LGSGTLVRESDPLVRPESTAGPWEEGGAGGTLVRMWRLTALVASGSLLGAVALALPAPAAAELKRVSFSHGPMRVGPYQVRARQSEPVRAPRVDGFLVRMHARVVDRRGRPIPVRRLMLHHVVYKNVGRFRGEHPDAVCGGRAESFYGTGEENAALRLPPGYGYRLRRGDRWLIGWMLMNHRNVPERAYIRYTAVVDTSRRLEPVRPFWARVTGCRGAGDPIFNVPGGRPPGSSFVKSERWRVPVSGRLVAGGSHVHGGSKEMLLTQATCGNRVLMSSRPLYGLPDHPYYNVLPVLHEPGPFATSWVSSTTGIPVRRGEVLRVSSLYDGELPHTRVMGIWHLYIAPGRPPARPCDPLPDDLDSSLPSTPGRSDPPRVTVPLTGLDERGRAHTILAPPGPVFRAGRKAEVVVADGSFNRRNISLGVGGLVRWRVRDRGLHDVTLANGPVGFASRWLRRGQSYRRRFARPGTYRLFCSLHPIDMTQVVSVRSGP